MGPVPAFPALSIGDYTRNRKVGVTMRAIQRWKQRKNGTQSAVSRVATALAFVSAGALAAGAVAVGALAIGRLAVGRFVLKSGEIDRLFINELQVNSLRVKEKSIE